MRKKFLFMTVLCFLLVSRPVMASGPKDIQGHWAERSIRWAIDQGIIKGYPDGSFKPNAPITKAEYYRITNQSEPVEVDVNLKAEDIFTDVDASSWYYQEVQKGLSSGYLDKTNDQVLNPNENIEREDAIRIVSHTQAWEDNLDGIYRFKDYKEISDQYKARVGAAVVHNLIQGYPDGSLKPHSSLTRAEVVTIVKTLKTGEKPVAKEWRWAFTNSGSNFSQGYKVHGKDTEKAGKWFNPSDVQVIRKRSRQSWGGSCFGFAYTAGLYAGDRFNVRDLNSPAVNTIEQVQPQSNYNAQSAINLFQVSQGTQAFQEFWRSKAKKWKAGENLSEYAGFIRGYIDSHKNGAPPVQLAVYWRENGRMVGHALVAYDYETQGDKLVVKVYDCNDLCERVIFDLANNTLVGLNLNPTSGTGQDQQIIQSYSFPTLDFAEFLESRSKNKLVYVTVNSDNTLEIDVDGRRQILDDNYTGGDIQYYMDGQGVTYLLEPGKNYSITGQGPVDLYFQDTEKGSNTMVTSDGFSKIFIGGDQVRVEGQKGAYTISSTSNSPSKGFPWDTLEAVGKDAGTFALRREASGYTIDGDNLAGTVINGYKKFAKDEKLVDVTSNKIRIYNNNGKIDIKEDQSKKDKYKDYYVDPDANDEIVGSWIGYDSMYYTHTGIQRRTENTLFISKNSNGTYNIINNIEIQDPVHREYNGDRYIVKYQNIEYNTKTQELLLKRSKSRSNNPNTKGSNVPLIYRNGQFSADYGEGNGAKYNKF